jgi:FKBP-type peptidyl-prolyl cis-trans isomerase FklB
MTRQSAFARLLVLLLLPATFGCQTTRGVQEKSTLMPKEQAVQESTVTQKEQSIAAPKAEASLALKDAKDKSSYSIGLDMARDVKAQDLGLNVEPLIQGIRDGLQGNKPLLSDVELETVRQVFVKERLAARAKALGPVAERNFRDGEAFLQQNAKKEGVKTLSSGLQYRVLKSGTGSTPGPEQNVKAHYVVRSIDGTELDSSYKQETPPVFPVQGIIPAWAEALQLMKEGDKWELFAPSYLAYGEKGVGKAVGPLQTLIFEMELIGLH